MVKMREIPPTVWSVATQQVCLAFCTILYWILFHKSFSLEYIDPSLKTYQRHVHNYIPWKSLLNKWKKNPVLGKSRLWCNWALDWSWILSSPWILGTGWNQTEHPRRTTSCSMGTWYNCRVDDVLPKNALPKQLLKMIISSFKCQMT